MTMSTSGRVSANDTLIKNLQDQVERLVEQLKDLEECRNDLTPDEYTSMREDTVEQIKEFTGTLDRMTKGDITLNNTFSTMRAAIRKAIASSFNTVEIIKMFGDQNTSDLEKQLLDLHENHKLKKINAEDYEKKENYHIAGIERHWSQSIEPRSRIFGHKMQW